MFSFSDTLVTTVKALDADDPEGPYGEVEYSLMGDQNTVPKFRIDPKTGDIFTTSQKLDREAQSSNQLIVKVKPVFFKSSMRLRNLRNLDIFLGLSDKSKMKG